MFFLEAVLGRTALGHDPHLLGHFGAGDDGVGRVVGPEDLGGEFVPHPVLDVAEAPVQRVLQMFGSGGHTTTVSRKKTVQTVMWQTEDILNNSVSERRRKIAS